MRKFLRPVMGTQAFMSFVDDAGRVDEAFPPHIVSVDALCEMYLRTTTAESNPEQHTTQDVAEIQLFDWYAGRRGP